MHSFLLQHIYLHDFVAALAMLGLGLEGYSADPELSVTDELILRSTP
ncbi:MAG: hypothetical protein ACXW1C_05760 [Gallionella sp.]